MCDEELCADSLPNYACENEVTIGHSSDDEIIRYPKTRISSSCSDSSPDSDDSEEE